MSFIAAIPVIGKIVEGIIGIIDKATIDKDLKEKLKADIQMSLLAQDHTEFLAALESRTKLIEAEAKSESWLARSWRPITMLTFVGLIVASWLGYTPPNMSEEMINMVFDIIKIGLGGYTIGRSCEKLAVPIAAALKK